MIKKYSEDLNELLKIAKSQGGQLNLSIILITIKSNGDDLQEIINFFEENNVNIVNSDVEPDSIIDIDNDIDNKISPFDPSKIDIKMDKMTIDSITKRVKHGELEFDSDFQRKSGLWKDVQKSQLIESILLKIPLPAFYFDATNDDKWLIIDGLQRISTLKEFVHEKKFKLKGMEFLTDLNGRTFNELPRSLQRRIEETNVNAYLVNPATPSNVKFNIFKRINTGGLVLEPQEIRNALYQGKAASFIKDLSKKKVFTSATCRGINTERMLDREFCLRYVAFTRESLEEYNSIEGFLNIAMENLNNVENSVLTEIEKDFERSMSNCKSLFGKHAFRKMSNDGRRRPINKALFETWSIIIKNLSDEEIKLIIQNKEKLISDFIILCDDERFLSALKASDKRAVFARVELASEIVNRITKGSDKS